MISQQTERTVVEIYYCPVCESNYRRNLSNITCLVYHGPGSCCHYMEDEILTETIDEVLAVLGDKKPANKED
jgi:hypothetical protein